MKRCFLSLCALFCVVVVGGLALVSTTKPQTNRSEQLYPYPGIVHINPVAAYEGVADEDLTDLMVPVPMKDRVFNKTGIQCVWASLELLGRYAEEPKLIGLTNDPECKSYSSPSGASRKLKQIGVKFEQTTSKSDRSLIIKGVVKERRGVLLGVPGHAMVLVHYDEEKGIVKYINNSDDELKVRTWTMEEFNKRWDGWICIVYADNDIIPFKYAPPASLLPIMDRNNPQGTYPKDYILIPKR